MCVFKGRRQDVNSAGFNILKDPLCKCFARQKIHSACLLDPNHSHMFLNGNRNAVHCSCKLQLVFIDWRVDCQLCKVGSCPRQDLSCLQGTLCSSREDCLTANLFWEFSPVKNNILIMSPAVHYQQSLGPPVWTGASTKLTGREKNTGQSSVIPL